MEHYLIPFEHIPLISPYLFSLSLLRTSSIAPTISHNCTFQTITMEFMVNVLERSNHAILMFLTKRLRIFLRFSLSAMSFSSIDSHWLIIIWCVLGLKLASIYLFFYFRYHIQFEKFYSSIFLSKIICIWNNKVLEILLIMYFTNCNDNRDETTEI